MLTTHRGDHRRRPGTRPTDRTSWRRIGWLTALVVAGALLTGGCVRVPAWQRGTHADRRMSWTRCAARSGARQHVFAVREGAAGGSGAMGGACGCD